MQLATYIQDLLYRYECVIIPGFGAFLTQYQPASFDAESATFLPPGKTVSFNRQLQTNDGLLANYVASVENTTYEVALQNIRNYTGSLSLQLMEEKSVVMDRIGEFVLNAENNVQFIPQTGSRFSTSSFGLSAVTALDISRANTTVYGEEKEVETKTTPLLFMPQERIKTPYLKYAAVGLIALMLAGAGGFGGLKLYEEGVLEDNFAAKERANDRIDSQIQATTFTFSNPLSAVNVTIPKETGKYHIVAGAFRIAENAQARKDQLINDGYDAKVITVNKYGLHPVIYNSYETRAEARQALRDIKRTENKSAWMLVKKLTE